MTDKNFNITILGGGPGGYTAAIRAAQLGFSVALIEKKYLGGTCLNIGCIPTKALIHSASVYEEIKGAKTFGVTSSEPNFDWDKIQKYKDRCVIKGRKGVEILMVKNKIEVINGHGKLTGPDTIDIDGMVIKSDNIILAMGSYARSLPSLPIDGDKVITSDHALFLSTLPKTMLIVGAGAIGCEFGYVLSNLGVEVTMVEFLDRALPMEDPDISTEFEQSLKRMKIKLHTRASVEGVEMTDTGVRAKVQPRDGGEAFYLDVDKVLVSVGRGPSTDNCGLDVVGVPVERGFIKVDKLQKTGVGDIRAIGDAVGGLMLAHKASAEGILAVEDIALKPVHPIVYENVPRATYCKPEVASVGLSQPEAETRYPGKIKTSRFPFGAVSKANIIGEGVGFAKLVAMGDDNQIVGAHAIGPHATDLIATATTAIGAGLTAEQFAHIIQAHPTLSEVWLEASHGLLDGALNM
jgi:dihydrolipoamide dehydrogenase